MLEIEMEEFIAKVRSMCGTHQQIMADLILPVEFQPFAQIVDAYMM